MAPSNDLGEYRISNLPPGKYFLFAAPMPGGIVRTEAVPLTYYPNADDTSGATPIPVSPGAQVSGIDFKLRKRPAFVVSGRVTGFPENGKPYVSIIPDGDPTIRELLTRSVTTNPDGSFALRGVTAGRYEIRAVLHAKDRHDQLMFARRIVVVGKQDVADVDLPLSLASSVVGTVRLAGDSPADLGRFRLGFHGVDDNSDFSHQADKNGSLEVTGIAPGEYAVVIVVPRGLYLKSLRIGDLDATSQTIEIQPGSQLKFEALLSPGGGRIDGKVEDADGKPAARMSPVPTRTICEVGGYVSSQRSRTACAPSRTMR